MGKKAIGKERVSTIIGKNNVVLVCPHGADDDYTAYITETAAMCGDYSAVINSGFLKSNSVDVLKNQADCNRIDHVTNNVLREEFLHPLNKSVSQIETTHVFYIHGFSDQVEIEEKAKIDIILGYGAGEHYNSFSCDIWRRDCFIYYWNEFYSSAYGGKGGGKYAGRNSNNMNQYFRKWAMNSKVQSYQLHLSRRLRLDKVTAMGTARKLEKVISIVGHCKDFDEMCKVKEI